MLPGTLPWKLFCYFPESCRPYPSGRGSALPPPLHFFPLQILIVYFGIWYVNLVPHCQLSSGVFFFQMSAPLPPWGRDKLPPLPFRLPQVKILFHWFEILFTCSVTVQKGNFHASFPYFSKSSPISLPLRLGKLPSFPISKILKGSCEILYVCYLVATYKSVSVHFHTNNKLGTVLERNKLLWSDLDIWPPYIYILTVLGDLWWVTKGIKMV